MKARLWPAGWRTQDRPAHTTFRRDSHTPLASLQKQSIATLILLVHGEGKKKFHACCCYENVQESTCAVALFDVIRSLYVAKEEEEAKVERGYSVHSPTFKRYRDLYLCDRFL